MPEEQAPSKSTRDTRKEKYDAEVRDATILLDYAIANGVLGAGNRKIDDDIIDAIKRAQDLTANPQAPIAEERAKFEKAYRDLAMALSPVTTVTLKATSDDYGERSMWTPREPRSDSIVWSRKLSAWTLIFVLMALTGTWLETVYGPLPHGQQAADAWPSLRQTVQFSLEILVPFTYGAIGACVALLKACQAYIHQRQFDPLRISEYYNRMILGSVSGGMIILLVQQVAGDHETIRISAATLGFLAGYNNELLFSAVERISEALLPKIGIDTLRRGSQSGSADSGQIEIGDVSLKDLLDRHKAAASDTERELYSGLIRKIQDRL